MLRLVLILMPAVASALSSTAVHVLEAHGAPVGDWMGKTWEHNITCPGHGNHSISCIFTPGNGKPWSSGDDPPDIVLYFAPYMCWSKNETGPLMQPPWGSKVPKLLFFSEPPQYTPCLFNQSLISHFDLLAGWRTCSAVYYQHFFPLHEWALAHAPVHIEKRIDAIAYMQKNCGSNLERHKLVQAIMALGEIEVHSYGSCMNNMQNRTLPLEMLPQFDGQKAPTNGDPHQKLSIFRHYKFCMAAENNRYQDYVSEKVWDALAVGCVPIYIGAPNIAQFLPDPESVILYDDFPSPALLMQELNRLRNNATAYAAKLAWRSKPLSELSPGFQSLVKNSADRGSLKAFQCNVCRLVASGALFSQSLRTWQPPCTF